MYNQIKCDTDVNYIFPNLTQSSGTIKLKYHKYIRKNNNVDEQKTTEKTGL